MRAIYDLASHHGSLRNDSFEIWKENILWSLRGIYFTRIWIIFLASVHVACHFLRHVVAFDFENSRLGFAIEEAKTLGKNALAFSWVAMLKSVVRNLFKIDQDAPQQIV